MNTPPEKGGNHGARHGDKSGSSSGSSSGRLWEVIVVVGYRRWKL